MADDPNQALPRLPLFFAQRLAQVREHEQFVRASSLPERTASNLPASDASRKRRIDDARGFTREAILEADIFRATAEQSLGRLAQEPRAGAVDELELLVMIEREHRNLDLRHHFAQQRGGFECVEALVPQSLDQRVHLDHHLPKRVAAARAARADGKVSLAERGEQVRQRLKGKDDAFAQRECEAQTERDDDDRQRPLDLGGVITRPEKDERDERAGQRRGERHQQDAAVVA